MFTNVAVVYPLELRMDASVGTSGSRPWETPPYLLQPWLLSVRPVRMLVVPGRVQGAWAWQLAYLIPEDARLSMKGEVFLS